MWAWDEVRALRGQRRSRHCQLLMAHLPVETEAEKCMWTWTYDLRCLAGQDDGHDVVACMCLQGEQAVRLVCGDGVM